MDERLNLSLTQKQQQTLAPMQLQFVRMLEMNSAEIEDEVARALDDNPALEAVSEPAETMAGNDEFGETAEQLQRADYGSADDIPSYRLGGSNRSSDDDYYEPVAVAGGQSLYEYLVNQLDQEPSLTDRDRRIAEYIVGNIDNNGYMERTLDAIIDDLAIDAGIDTDRSEVGRVWDVVRSLEPAGIGAVDLRDSLLLQLHRKESTPQVRLAIEIVDHYFDLFSLMHFERIASLTGSTREQIREAMDTIRTLNPKPGSLIAGDDDDRTRHITPDFYIEADDDRLSLTMTSRLPRLQIEQSFASDTAVGSRNTVASNAANLFISQRRDDAAMFIKALEMRRATLFRVMSAIMQWQREFFITGDRLRLRPMVLKDIASVTGDDISVISRATTGKYVATPHGVYSLKSLFNERRRDDSEASSETVMHMIREAIDNEDKKHPLSDADITDILTGRGLDIARRTVAKYRERLSIPVARLRRTV
ncbi:MAG: RNA polymerase factor sigma-54 [Bacteroides sp.]|nr:RNA polymerase factor sigma-54 [Bacteroides sp.]MCM1414135.1 RNA polymerase factor sigma-54 [Bacteroides sp.]MCM1471001.1 RNA polymerase factor sigma-54 [Bacteroides sp.]